MTPSDARNLAIDYGRKAEMHLAVDDFAAARSCLGLAKEYASIGLRIEQESRLVNGCSRPTRSQFAPSLATRGFDTSVAPFQSFSPTSSPCETKQAGAIPPRLRPAPIHPNTERTA